jgi:spermidine/putrescine transport system permease protein
MKLMVGFYVVLFFGYLFGPLILMGASAFNQSPFPQVTPWEGFTGEWFGVLLANRDMMTGIYNSLIIGFGVICLSVPISLAAALMMTQIYERVRPIYYVIVVSPVLTPGVILGISTLVFWDKLGTEFGADYESVFYDGIFLSVVGQSTFISAYCMLIFLARLQRFDRTQEEAALDLGATHVQVFWKILIPFLRPAIFSAAVLAFLTSFENYNTTVFTIQAESTLTTVLSGQIRLGTEPDVSALAVIIVCITLVGALTHEIMRRREQAKEEAAKEAAKRAEMEIDMKLAAQAAAAA